MAKLIQLGFNVYQLKYSIPLTVLNILLLNCYFVILQCGEVGWLTNNFTNQSTLYL